MSEQMAGSVDIYTQGYDKGFEEGRRMGYLVGMNFAMKQIMLAAQTIKDEVISEK